MRNKGVKVGFVKTAINSLSQEQFNELVRIFQETYWERNEIVGVDGSGDGGCDIKIFVDKKEQKKCVQITVQKALDAKIKNSLTKAKNLVNLFNYSPSLEFYCNSNISNTKLEEYKKDAKIAYGIELDIFDVTRIAELGGSPIEEYVYGLHSDVIVKPSEMTFEKSNKFLYDLLASGTASSNIKNSILESVLVAIIYEKEVIKTSDLKIEAEKRLGKNLSDITSLINSLKSDQRIVKDPNIMGGVRLSEGEKRTVKDIYATSMDLENSFNTEFDFLVAKYHISNREAVYNGLKRLYKLNYTNDIKDIDANEDNVSQKNLDEFKNCVARLLPDHSQLDIFVMDIKHLCDSNNYMNKIIAGETFVSLYQSNKLESYLNRKQKTIFLDTPAFIYYLCATYGEDLGTSDWDDPFYRSMKSLISLQKTNNQRIIFCVMEDYLYEITNEIKKALQISKFENYPFFKDLGTTRNTIYNYYSYLKTNDLFDINDNIECLEDFLELLGFENTDFSNGYFQNNTLKNLHEFAEDSQIIIEKRPFCENFMSIVEFYSKKLLSINKEKSYYAINNDVNQVISALEYDKTIDRYIATWDTTLHHIRLHMINVDSTNRYSYFYISNPAKLSNRLALECFNIDASALTNDIFAYADKKYDITKRVKTLLEMISPYIKSENVSGKLVRKLAQLRKKQCENIDTDENLSLEDRTLPVEEALALLIPDSETIKNDSSIVTKFSIYMNSVDNSDYIIRIIEEIMKEKDYKKYDLSSYWERIKQVNL